LQVPPHPPPFVNDTFYDALLRSSLEEMASEYVYSMKKAIVNYVTMWVIANDALAVLWVCCTVYA